MSETRFDRSAGTLRVTASALVSLGQVGRGQSIDAEAEAELDSGGLMSDGGLDDRLLPLAKVTGEPFVRVSLEHAVAARRTRMEGWVDDRIGVLAVAEGDRFDAFDIAAVSRSMLPAQVAGLVELGPRDRPKVTDPMELDRGLLEALSAGRGAFTNAEVERLVEAEDDILPAWIEVLSGISRDRSARWRVGAWWNSERERPTARSMEILDADVGLFLIHPVFQPGQRFQRVLLRPVSPSQVWRLLCALLPRAEEVAGPLEP